MAFCISSSIAPVTPPITIERQPAQQVDEIAEAFGPQSSIIISSALEVVAKPTTKASVKNIFFIIFSIYVS
jgi:hypothetical protein